MSATNIFTSSYLKLKKENIINIKLKGTSGCIGSPTTKEMIEELETETPLIVKYDEGIIISEIEIKAIEELSTLNVVTTDSLSTIDSVSNSLQNEKKTKRTRMTLNEKKILVNKFKEERLECFKENLRLNSSEDGKINRIETSCKKFCKENGIAKDAMLCSWLRMDMLGQFEEWNGENNLSKCNLPKGLNLVKQINKGLEYNEYMEICMSKVVKNQYGVIAKCDIASNKLIGYYKGLLVNKNETFSDYKSEIGFNEKGEFMVLDAIEFLSCHGRYINDSGKKLKENVIMILRDKEENINKKIEIKTIRKIRKGDEILSNYGVKYWEDNACTMHTNDCRRKFSLSLAKRKRENEENDSNDEYDE